MEVWLLQCLDQFRYLFVTDDVTIDARMQLQLEHTIVVFYYPIAG
jgi:hypothetical protein